MDFDDDFDASQEKTLFNVKCQSIKEIHELNGLPLKSLRIIHSPDLISMIGVEQFKQLKHLNLSQNSLQAMNLKNLIFLESLNLQSNRIKVINCDGLKRLHTLNLSFNLITQLQPLQIFCNQDYTLKSLDMRSNSITELSELKYIVSIKTLQEVLFNSDIRKNPICQNEFQYHKILMQNPTIKQIDKKSIQELKNQPQRLVNSVDESDQRGVIEREAEIRLEIIQLQQKVKDLSNQNRELVYKFECNDRYWSQRCSNLENEIVEQQKFNKELSIENKKFRKQIELYKQQCDEQEENNKDLLNKKDRKDEIINQLQQRVSDLLHTNGQVSKENQILIEQITNFKSQLQDKDHKQNDLKSQLKEAEKALGEFHKNAVDQASQTLLRQESLQQKVEQVHSENRQLFQDNASLKKRIQELLEICREWEVKYENTMKDNEQNLELVLTQLKLEYEQKLKDQQNQFEEQLREFDQESKYMQDQLENEFRTIFKEMQDKYKSLKIQFEDKLKLENELTTTIKYLNMRIQDQDKVIEELQNGLLKMKKELQDSNADKDLTIREQQIDLQNKQRELQQNIDQIGNLQLKVQQFEREFKLINDENQQMNLENDKLKMILKQKIGLEQQVEELQTTIAIKNKMLDDKNDSIDELKSQLNQIKNQEGVAQDDYNKLLRRYERQNSQIDDYENQIQQLQEDYDEKCKELREQKQLISLFEKEVEDIKDKQDKEINTIKQDLIDKDQNIIDLVKVLDEAKENIRKKEDKLKELTQQYQQLDKQLISLDKYYEQQIQEKDKLIKTQKTEISILKTDIEKLSEENEKQKRLVRENLQNLNKLFT